MYFVYSSIEVMSASFYDCMMPLPHGYLIKFIKIK